MPPLSSIVTIVGRIRLPVVNVGQASKEAAYFSKEMLTFQKIL
jgi:hypothetical protein